MLVSISGRFCICVREKTDPRFKNESHFLYHVKEELNKQGHDLIKKRAHKDGHLVSETHQYLRSRKPKPFSNSCITIRNERYAIEDAGKEFNKIGSYTLAVNW